jgi:predicted Fe-Mo cluster-binding NifX family protein
MKVAVVSSDGKVINQHFGIASRFFIQEALKNIEFTWLNEHQ